MNKFFAKEYTVVRGRKHWAVYPSYIKWCKDNIGVRGSYWEWEKGWIKRDHPDNPSYPFCSSQTITFLFEREEDYMQFLLTHIA